MSHLPKLQRTRRELKVGVADFALLRLFGMIYKHCGELLLDCSDPMKTGSKKICDDDLRCDGCLRPQSC